MATVDELRARREALSAARASTAARVSYDRRTVDHKVALVAIMQEVLLLANALIRDDRECTRSGPDITGPLQGMD